MPSLSTRVSEDGGLLLSTALLIFGLSLLAAGGMLVLLWQDTGQSTSAIVALIKGEPLPEPTAALPNPDDPLQPDFTVSAALTQDQAELEKQLRDPLRLYYATKPERLKKTMVDVADLEPHTTRVTLTLATVHGEEIVTFFYDRTGKERDGAYPKWEPSMFDNKK